MHSLHIFVKFKQKKTGKIQNIYAHYISVDLKITVYVKF